MALNSSNSFSLGNLLPYNFSDCNQSLEYLCL
jgi:hypothetical protein